MGTTTTEENMAALSKQIEKDLGVFTPTDRLTILDDLKSVTEDILTNRRDAFFNALFATEKENNEEEPCGPS